jgi:hypothetical protein
MCVDLLSDLWAFVAAVIQRWPWWVGIVLFFTDVLNTWGVKDKRHWLRAIAFVALFYSTFLTWRDEHAKTKTAPDPDRLAYVECRLEIERRSHEPRHLSKQQRDGIVTLMAADRGRYVVELFTLAGCNDCLAFAKDIREVFETLKWHVEQRPGTFRDPMYGLQFLYAPQPDGKPFILTTRPDLFMSAIGSDSDASLPPSC